MRKYLLIFTLLLFTISLSVNAQIDDDVDYEEFSSTPISSRFGENSVINKYRLGDGLRISARNGSSTVSLNGYVQTNMFVQKYPDIDDLYVRWRVRRARMLLNGYAFNNRIRYRLGIEFVKGSEGDDNTGNLIHDAWVQYRPFGNNRLMFTIGQRNTPTDNRELLMTSYTLQFVERSRVTSLFGTIREVGIFAESTLKIGEKSYLRPSLALTDGDGPMSKGKRYGGMKFGGRVNYLPFGLFRISGETRQSDMVYELTPKLLIGAAYSYNSGVTDRRGGRESGSILYRNDKDEDELPDYGKLNADILFKYRGFSLIGEFAKSWAYVPSAITQRVRNNGTTATDFVVDGEQNVAAYIKNRMILGSAFNIQAGYMFRNFFSVDLRYTHIDPDKYSFLYNKLYFNRNNYYEISVSKYLTKSYAAKIQASFGLVDTDGDVETHHNTGFRQTVSGYEKTFNLMLQLAF